MKDTYSINEVAMMTSLSTRTIRNYIAAGFLEGEKVDGAWTFTPEQIEAFTQNKTVKPSIKAKKNAIVFCIFHKKIRRGSMPRRMYSFFTQA